MNLLPFVLLVSGAVSLRQPPFPSRTDSLFRQRSRRYSSDSTDLATSAEKLRSQAEALRAEATAIEVALNETRLEKQNKELANVDRWIEQLLVNQTVNEYTQLLNTREQVTLLLRDERFSPEQVNKIFQRLCDTCPIKGRDSLDRTPLLRLLVEAAGKLDEIEPEDNPNKRWNGRVERGLMKKLFAKEWGIELEDEYQSDRFL
jgi:outer membrane murein-binding lipoprotein Lpp